MRYPGVLAGWGGRAAVVLLVAVASFATGCGDTARAPGASAPPGSGGLRAYPPVGGSPETVVRTYVEALDRRDGTRFCSAVAPWISGRYDMAGEQLDRNGTGRRWDCPAFIHGFIGYIEDCCPPEFVHARIESLRTTEDGDLVRADAKVRIDQTDEDRPVSKTIDDVIWLVRVGGGWRVAQLSATAAIASISAAGDNERAALDRPDIAAKTKAFAAERAAYEARAGARAGATTTAGKPERCDGGVAIDDPAGDAVDYQFPAPKSPAPDTPGVDIRSVRLVVRGEDVCLRIETAGPLELVGTATLRFHDARGEQTPGGMYLRLFDVVIRPDGTTLVTSGRDTGGRDLPVPADVGRDGRALSVRLDHASFAAGRDAPASSGTREGDFGFGVALTARLSAKRMLHDDLGPERSPQQFAYPSGRPCPLTGC
jgi:hypothetical protein